MRADEPDEVEDPRKRGNGIGKGKGNPPTPDDAEDDDLDGEDPLDAALDDIEDVDPDAVGLDTEDLELRDLEGALEEFVYDLDGGKHQEFWSEIDDDERNEIVQKAHLRGRHPWGASLHLHAAMHVVVENQIALGEPPIVRATVERFRKAGVPRHEAIHAVGSVLAQQVFETQRRLRPIPAGAYERNVAALDPKEWMPKP
jgi:hypothetical protein